MRVTMRRPGQAGFAVIELILVLVIVAGVVGVGTYVYKQKQNADSLTAAATSSTKAASTKPVAAVPAAGTSAAIDELTNAMVSDETSANSSGDGQLQQDVLSSNTAVSNVGGAYNEASF